MRCTFVPSASMVKICGRPVRPLTNAICAPVLRFQVGEMSGPCPEVRRFRLLPEASIVKIFGYPLRDDEIASFAPSGDQEGEKFIPPKCGKLTIRPRSTE